ncbi:MAG: 2-oxoglutarate dehydrogenase E1 component [Weeksellaceae bacterium]|jgi:2-oxoglutarate dehydrogenase E1 component|nr:2-oxoglutarate dehydrogenase E1 component [Weeksellaceae bacterium]MDX9705467.1 2-oxoglutarate dehydrogenase E1 component [Weeksellaceae bacterium]
MEKFSFLNALHSEYIAELYEQYKHYPDSVEPSWRAFFQGFDFATTSYNGHSLTEERATEEINYEIPEKIQKEFKVINLIDAYRSRGHLFTKTNPIRERRQHYPTLDLNNFGLTESDLDETFDAGSIIGIRTATSLRNIIAYLKNMYCESIGVEYMHILDPEKNKWIQNWLNTNLNRPKLSIQEKERILLKLNEAVAFENFLHTKFVGQKRFSLEGNESLIPALDAVINRAAEAGVEEVVIGMAHRGRLNVLANVMRKSYSQIFSEFEGKEFSEDIFSGDVKYHLGSTSYTQTHSGKKIKLNLAPNPSHLEAVDSIVEGIARAKGDLDYEGDYSRILPILIHGDAAIAAQGIVYEVIQMMNLDGYKTGGTIHIVTNNQIGFTTNYLDARSSTYCTDIAKVTLSPVMHVNSDDAEAVVHALHFAADYRMRFGQDVFIDLLGYRKYGHNEGDEPRFTQPKLYSLISKHPNPREIYRQHLIKEGVIGDDILAEKEKEFKQLLEENFDASKEIEKNTLEPFMPDEWKDFSIVKEAEMLEPVNTAYPKEKLVEISDVITTVPEGKKVMRKIQRLLDQRKQMVADNKLDWAMGELLAYGSIVEEGHPVRLSGEDVERGTFSHRHAVIKTEDTEEEIILLNHISKNQAAYTVYNSLLSEYAVLGYDYGYAMAAAHGLTIWEAQFGDFANGGQIIIDQYISAAEDKWKIQNGLVMLLPHGYEGQGAEHSSARMERFLQLCAQSNMFVVNCTSPANFFHVLRRQVKTSYRKPLIVFTPKSLLRHPLAVSTVEELTEGSFQTLIDDAEAQVDKVEKVVFCQGKFYYDLLNKKEELQAENVALIRLEQLYPLDKEKINQILDKYSNRKQLIWAQEEPENMGAWTYLLRKLREVPFELVSPPESAAPASGSHKAAEIKHNNTINKVFE